MTGRIWTRKRGREAMDAFGAINSLREVGRASTPGSSPSKPRLPRHGRNLMMPGI